MLSANTRVRPIYPKGWGRRGMAIVGVGQPCPAEWIQHAAPVRSSGLYPFRRPSPTTVQRPHLLTTSPSHPSLPLSGLSDGARVLRSFQNVRTNDRKQDKRDKRNDKIAKTKFNSRSILQDIILLILFQCITRLRIIITDVECISYFIRCELV